MHLNLDRARSIVGWMTDPELEFLAKTARNSDIIVEFGCYCGRSTRAMLDNTKALLFAVDPWVPEYYDKNGKPLNILRPDAYECFRQNVSEYISSGQCEIIRCKSGEFPEIGRGFASFVFIDADHRFEEVIRDIHLARKLVAKGGIIAGHDYGRDDWPGVKQAVDLIFPESQKVASIWWVKM
jgi:predicted O-methyltransferase YrrM